MSDLIDKLKVALEGHYSVKQELGEGGMAFVFLAHDDNLDREVAIKVMKPDLAASVGAERFLREIRIAAKLNHPHILPVFDSGDADGLLYYVMPFIQGESLSDMLAREQQLSIEDAVRITCEVAEALAEAHSQGIVHRDIKPQNIMMSGGHAIVADFGIARALSSAGAESLTQTGTSVGTPAYMSPEQSAGDPNVDGRADIYSLGCVLYELLVGQIPFTGATPQQIMARHSIDMVPPPHIMRQSIPADLEDIIMCALAKVPADRFRTAQQFAEALAAFASGQAPHVRTTGIQRRHPQRKRRPAMLWPVGIGTVIVVAGVLTWQLAFTDGNSRSARLAETGLDPRNIAVLYFEDLSADSSLGYVVDGITEDLINELSIVSGLNVISRNGVEPYRDVAISNDSIARALKTGSLVTGSVEPVGNRYRITVRLVDGFSGTDLERTTVELPSDRVLTVRDSVAKSVSSFLRQRLGEEVALRDRRAGTTNNAAWTLLQRAARLQKDAAGLEDTDADRATRAYLESDSIAVLAAAADPAWVEPIVLRGWAYYHLAFLSGGQQRVQYMQTAIEQGMAAIATDPTYADAFHLRGRSRYVLYRMETTPDQQERARLLDDAQADLQAAVDADGSLANAWYAISNLYYDREDNVSAVIAARRAYEADAFLSNQDRNVLQLYKTHYDLEQFQDADTWCNEGARRFPGDFRFVECQLFMLITPWATPDVNRAWILARTIDSVAPDDDREFLSHRARMLVGGTLARAGMADSARAVLEAARAGGDIDPDQQLASDEAVMRVILGDYDEAIDLYKRFVAANPGHEIDIDRDLHWWWRPLRDYPEFRAAAGGGNH